MNMHYSLTIAGLLVMVITKLLQSSGIEVATESIQNFVVVLLQVVGAIAIYWGRFRQGDITWYGSRV